MVGSSRAVRTSALFVTQTKTRKGIVMKRSINVGLVTLPRLNVATAMGLAAQLITAAEKAGPLSQQVSPALEAMVRCRHKLHQCLIQAEDPPLVESDRSRITDARIDRCYRSLDHWLEGWSMLPDAGPNARRATAIRG